MRRPAVVLLHLAAAVVTLAAYGLAVVVTGFLACGVSGCGGGGFGPSFSPVEAQAGLVVSGLLLVPVALLATRRWGAAVMTAAGAGAAVLGVLAAMTLTGLGPHGCPAGQSRAVAGPEAFDPGAATCSGDRDAAG